MADFLMMRHLGAELENTKMQLEHMIGETQRLAETKKVSVDTVSVPIDENDEIDREIADFVEKRRRKAMQLPAAITIQAYWRMFWQRRRFLLFRVRRQKFAKHFLQKWIEFHLARKHYLKQLLSKIIERWREEVEETKQVIWVSKKLILNSVGNSGMPSTVVMNLVGNSDNIGVNNRIGDVQMVQRMQQVVQVRIKTVTFKAWVSFWSNQKRRRNIAIRKLEAMQAKIQWCPTSILLNAEVKQLVLQMWHRYTVYRQCTRFDLPLPSFGDERCLYWEQWLKRRNEFLDSCATAEQMAPKVTMRRAFLRWDRFHTLCLSIKMKEKDAADHANNKLMGSTFAMWARCVKQRGRRIRLLRDFFGAWSNHARLYFGIRTCKQMVRERGKTRIMKAVWSTWRARQRAHLLSRVAHMDRLLTARPKAQFSMNMAMETWKEDSVAGRAAMYRCFP
eukprot:TRINITY_DN128027_c0_g2_i1.p1 TRINITY_DN128027_c0_g2~~TRINITY_DN128027_c0_g2_i1.p1  ORF type:complete len:448 (+),score=113.08 TRINITY_DN128027_c0_g2_i1:136-1479(+)